jgi:enoyl-CoA hydratase/carnithine racemase
MSEEQTVTYELEGEIALVGLNRPDKSIDTAVLTG